MSSAGTGPPAEGETSPAAPPQGGSRGCAWRRAVLLCAALAGSALVAWSSLGTWQVPFFDRPQEDYYNLLVHGFRKGSLALDKVVPDALIHAENPWDPDKRPSNVGAHDVSYFGGHYYVYFGVAPVVTLFWPFRALTGHDLPLVYGTLAYSLGAFLISAWLLLRILRDHFPRAGLGTRVAAMLVPGLAGGQLVLARRISIWEPPIAAGHFFAVAMFAFGYLATRSRRPWGWLAASGASLGLAFGSRPTLAAAGAGLAVIVAAVGARALPAGGWRALVRRTALAACAAGLPLGAVVSGVLWYNYARFRDPLEFGLKYQMTSQNEMLAHHFSLSFVPFNFAVYFLTPPNWGRYFPFVHPITQPPHPLTGYYGIEFVYGALVVCPVLWWILTLPAFALPRAGRPPVPAIAWAFAATAVATTALLLCFNTAAGRYTVDFMPWWAALGVLGWAVLDRALPHAPGSAGTGGLLRALFLATAVFSLALAFFQSCDLHGLLKYWSPRTYTRISRVFDEPAALAERLAGYQGGPVEMDVTFPARALRSFEPLVVTGVEYEKDYVYVYYLSDTMVRIGCNSGGRDLRSADLKVEPGRTYRLRVECSSLYPPAGHPFYDGWSDEEVHSVKSWARIEMDGRVVLDARMPGNEASPGTVRIGCDKPNGTYGAVFTGTIGRVSRGGWRRPAVDLASSGDFELRLTLAGDPANQPLIAAGSPGRADVLGIRSQDRGHFVLVYESWGYGLWQSAPVAVADSQAASLRVRFGPLLRVGEASPLAILRRSLVVWSAGKPVWWYRTVRELDPNPALGMFDNSIGSTAMAPEFEGRIDSVARDPQPWAWRPGPFAAIELQLAGRGTGSEPLVASGHRGRADTLAVAWLSGDRAQILYDHSGEPVRKSRVFEWPDGRLVQLRAELPSLSALDSPDALGRGTVRIDLNSRRVWEEKVPFYPAPSASVAVGRNAAASPAAGDELTCVVADLSQSAR